MAQRAAKRDITIEGHDAWAGLLPAAPAASSMTR